jgi:hypothetical protein
MLFQLLHVPSNFFINLQKGAHEYGPLQRYDYFLAILQDCSAVKLTGALTFNKNI